MFDTLQATKDLKEAGIESNAADAIVMAFGVIAENMVSKDDLQGFMKGFATREDMKGFATKEDLKDFATREDLKGFATREDLLVLKSEMATKEDLKGFATREDLQTFRDYFFDHYATKNDLLKLGSNLRQEMNELTVKMSELTVKVSEQTVKISEQNARHHQDFANLYKHIWFVGMGIVGINVLVTTAIIAAAKYLL